MGYNENQYSLPRMQDLTVSRQGMYDDTYNKAVTQGWMFIPLVDYHAGGSAAAFEPLSQNYVDFAFAVKQYFLLGILPCWRGYEIFDSNATQALVTKYVSIYKTHRDIITSDLIHIRRADLLGWDAMMHVNPNLPNGSVKGFLVVFNPTEQVFPQCGGTEYIKVPTSVTYDVSRDYTIDVPIVVDALNITWYLLQ